MYKSPKIIVSKLAKNLTAMADLNGEFASTNTTLIYGIENIDKITVLTAILNSSLMNFVYKTAFSGLNLLGSFQFQAPQVRLLPIAKLLMESPVYDDILKTSKEIINNTKKYDNTKQLIDNLVYKLYGLTPEEIAIIEDSMK
jgi:hypothetical protein